MFGLTIQKVGLSRCRLQFDSIHGETLLAVAKVTLPTGQLVMRARVQGDQGTQVRDFDVDLQQNINLNFALTYYLHRV